MTKPPATSAAPGSAAAQPSVWSRLRAIFARRHAPPTPPLRPPPDPALVAAVTATFAPWRARWTRSAWRPVIANDNSAVEVVEVGSWFGGDPLLPADTDWPSCTSCRQPMRFMLQLNLQRLPDRCDTTPREGLLSFFYCSVDDGDCETWTPFSGCHSLGIVPASSFSTLKLRTGGPSPFRRQLIRGWDEVADLPDPGDHEACGIVSTFNRAAHIWAFDCAAEGIHLDEVEGGVSLRDVAGTALEHDKLGGWPLWVQTPDRPLCPVCQSEMRLVLQVDSHDHLDYMFGDHGCGHIMQCHKHPEQLAFGWACM